MCVTKQVWTRSMSLFSECNSKNSLLICFYLQCCWHHACSCCMLSKITWAISYFNKISGMYLITFVKKMQFSVVCVFENLYSSHQLVLCITLGTTTRFLERHAAKYLFRTLSVSYFIALKVSKISRALCLCKINLPCFELNQKPYFISRYAGTTITLTEGLG